MHTLRLRLLVDGGSVRISLDDGGGRPIEALATADALARVVGEVHAALAPRPGLVVAGRDAARTAAEERAGRTLAGLLDDPGLTGRLGWALGVARGAGVSATLVVDAPDAAVRALPWELLCDPTDGVPLEPSGRCVVARLAPAPHPPGPRGPVTAVATWCPTPDDPVCRARLADVAPRLEAIAPPATAGAGPLIAHVVCHGEGLADGVRVLVGDEDRAAGSAAHALGAALSAAALVVLDVCEGAAPAVDERDTLAGRVLAAGADACLAPLRRLPVEVARAFSAGLYAALAAGEPLPAAVAAGRREVRALGDPRPDARWCVMALWVAHAGVLARGPMVTPGWRPPGWPSPAPDAAGLLSRAHALSRELHSGFVGVEHLALAVGAATGPIAGVAAARAARGADDIRRLLAGWVPTGSVGDPAPTPRLVALGAVLGPGFDVEALFEALRADATHALHDVLWPAAEADLDATMRSVSGHRPVGTPAAGLEVAAGPEDGRVLPLAPGDVVGRAVAGGTAHGLYDRTAVSDRRLSREHLRWVGPGAVEALRPIRLHRGGRVERIEAGRVEVRVGDLLHLGLQGDMLAGTLLRAW